MLPGLVRSEGVRAASLRLTAAASLPPGGWRLVHSPSPRDGAFLESVSCASATLCMAAGAGDNAFVEGWNGTSWSVVPSPSRGLASALMSISCASTTFCVAGVAVVAGHDDSFQVAVGTGFFNTNPLVRTVIAMHG